jgi:hypothetical protein
MPLYEKLQNHRGGLITISSKFCFHLIGVWEPESNRTCLVLDVILHNSMTTGDASTLFGMSNATTGDLTRMSRTSLVKLLLDGGVYLVWVHESDIEIIDGTT